MNLLKSLFIILLLLDIYTPSYASVGHDKNFTCGMFNDENDSGVDGDRKEGDKKETEEEPDCE